MFDVEFKPNTDVTLDLNGFYSKLQATNYNRNYLLVGPELHQQAVRASRRPGLRRPQRHAGATSSTPTYVDDAGVTQSPAHGIYDQISRPGEASDTKYLDFDAKFRVNDKLKVTTKLGVSNGKGVTPTQDVMEFDIDGTGAAYTLNGTNTAPSVSFPGGDTSTPRRIATLDWIFGLNNVKREGQRKLATDRLPTTTSTSACSPA